MFDKADAVRRLVIDTARLTGLDALARPFLGGVGAILMLHRVSAAAVSPDSPNRHLTIAPAFLDRTLATMKADGFAFVSMDEALERLRAGAGGGRFATVTADDGYRDNLYEALPVLEHHGAPMTIFIAPALTDGLVPLWWEAIEDIAFSGRPVRLPGGETLAPRTPSQKLAAFHRLHAILAEQTGETEQAAVLRALAEQAETDPMRAARELLADWTEVKTLAAHPLVTVGAHTMHHFNLKRLPADLAVAQLHESRRRLHAELGAAPRHFAYPYGYADAAGAREVELVRDAGFASAVTTRHGVLQHGHVDHLHALPRLSLNGRFQNPAQARVMTRGFTAPLANRGRRLVTI